MAEKRLQGKRVLVTRPREQAAELVAAITQAGGVALQMPVIEIEVLDDAELNRQKILDLDRFDTVIAVSSNAARLGLDRIDCYWPQLPAHIEWLAVGEATAAAFLKYSVTAETPRRGFTSEALLAMPQLQQVSGRRILIFKGVGGRQLLIDELKGRGAQVDVLDLYRRKPVSYTQADIEQRFEQGMPEVIVANSVETLENLEPVLLPILPGLRDLTFLVASERIAEAARRRGYRHIINTDGASTGSTMAALNVIA